MKYLEDGKRDTFSEYTLTILARGLELNFTDILEIIDQLNYKSSPNELFLKKLFTNKLIPFFIPALLVVLIFLLLIGKEENLFNNYNQLADVQIHSQYPEIIVAFDGKGYKLWQKNIKNSIKKVAKTDLVGDGNKEIIAAAW